MHNNVKNFKSFVLESNNGIYDALDHLIEAHVVMHLVLLTINLQYL